MEPSLRSWIEANLAGHRVVAERDLTGGYSNHNIQLTTDDGAQFVLRRYLGANACAVESALARKLTGVVPVPEVIAADETGKTAGEPVLLSAFVPGEQVGAVLTPATAPDLGREVGATLAAIGSVTFDAPGFFADAGLQPGPPGAEPIAGLDAFVDRCLREGNAAGHLTDDEQRALRRYAEEATPGLAALAGSRHLVHSDYNPKNLLAARRGDGWSLVAVLDWEYAFSSSPLFDVGNMLRFPRPAGFEGAFLDGFRAAGGELPPDWRQLSQAIDLYALADFLTRPVEHRYFGRAVERIRTLLSGG
ncbi:phosphotransferase family protein [Paractinoplanes globisporus]|uniref:Phosphotransferase family protein n=1 Tax=Paractinoplanes globisporus TaxID=113565 RepID=A0ABW6WW65_9ACTN|nr:phosphotransferase [Actinoplanes globisporus]